MQNTTIDQIRRMEDEIDKKVRQAETDAKEYLQQYALEAEAQVMTRQKALDAHRREKVEQVENEMALEKEKQLTEAQAEATTIRSCAMTHRNEAVAMVVQALLDRM